MVRVKIGKVFLFPNPTIVSMPLPSEPILRIVYSISAATSRSETPISSAAIPASKPASAISNPYLRTAISASLFEARIIL